jgi:hypothetical protein
MFIKELRQAGHTRRFVITEARDEGWEVREEADDRILRVQHYRDWHRVERARLRMEQEVLNLEDRGWT